MGNKMLTVIRNRVMYLLPLLAVLCSALFLAGCGDTDSAESESTLESEPTPSSIQKEAEQGKADQDSALTTPVSDDGSGASEVDQNSVLTTKLPADLSLTTDAGLAPESAPSNGRILFTSNRDGNPPIYVMNSDGSGQICLTNSAYSDYDPEWSPDGSKIAFSSTRGGYLGDIYLMNADGSDPTRLTYTKGFDTTVRNMDAAWSPDGSRIAFTITGGLAPLSRIHTLHVPTSDHVPPRHVPYAMSVHDKRSSYTFPQRGRCARK